MPQIYIPKDLYDRCMEEHIDLPGEVRNALRERLALIAKKGKQR